MAAVEHLVRKLHCRMDDLGRLGSRTGGTKTWWFGCDERQGRRAFTKIGGDGVNVK